MTPSAPISQDALKVLVKEKVNLPVLQMGQNLPVPRFSFPNDSEEQKFIHHPIVNRVKSEINSKSLSLGNIIMFPEIPRPLTLGYTVNQA